MEFPVGLLLVTLSLVVVGVKSDGVESAVIPLLEKLTKEFPIDRFSTDVVLMQKVDSINSITKYYLKGDENKTTLYIRNENDKARDVIVFTSEEDKIHTIHSKATKRIYVVLKKKKDGEYHVTLAFLRPATENDLSSPIQIEGKKQSIEWVMYDEHVVPGRPTTTFTVIHCASSFLAPCTFNEKALVPADHFVKAPHHYIPKAIDLTKVADVEDKIEGDQDHGELFADLDFRQGAFEGQGRSFSGGGQVNMNTPAYQGGGNYGTPMTQYGSSGYPMQTADGKPGEVLAYPQGTGQPEGVGVVGGALSTVGAVVCGVVSVIASCADERQYNNKMPIGMAAKEGWNKNDQAGFGISNYVGRRRKRSAETELLEYPGWRTQFHKATKGIIKGVEANEVFYGLGNCPYIPVDQHKFDGGPDDLVDAYLTLLRTGCVTWMKEIVHKLIEMKYLLAHNKVLEVNTYLPVYHEAKLNVEETILMASASELDAVSHAYIAEHEHPSSLKSPNGKLDITRSVAFLTNVGLIALQRFKDYSPQHSIFLSRHLLQAFKAIFSKLRQDLQNLQPCGPDCAEDLAIYWGDRMQIQGMIEYIRFGGDGSKDDFNNFYSKNYAKIEELVNIYS